MAVTYDFGDNKIHAAIIKQTWIEFRDALAEGSFAYNDLEHAQQTAFLRAFDELFCENYIGRFFNVKLEKLRRSSECVLVRGSIIKQTEPIKSLADFKPDRLEPKSRFITSDNRFSPPGVEWLYLALGDNYEEAKECSIAECRAKAGDNFGCYKFVIKPHYENRKIADLTIANGMAAEDLEIEFNRYADKKSKELAARVLAGKVDINKYRSNVLNKFSGIFACLYGLWLSNNIFERVESYADKDGSQVQICV
jgi:hypothetical protein